MPNNFYMAKALPTRMPLVGHIEALANTPKTKNVSQQYEAIIIRNCNLGYPRANNRPTAKSRGIWSKAFSKSQRGAPAPPDPCGGGCRPPDLLQKSTVNAGQRPATIGMFGCSIVLPVARLKEYR